MPMDSVRGEGEEREESTWGRGNSMCKETLRYKIMVQLMN